METSIKQWLGNGSINLFGIPFAGKDTQGHLLAEQFEAALLGGGDILRNSVIPAHVKAAMDKGGLIPTSDYIDIVLPYLGREEFSGKPLVLSSVGRWHGEEEGVVQALERSSHPLKAVIFLNIDEDTLYERWQVSQETGDRGDRSDDANKEKLAMRLDEFRNKTLPVIDFYRKAGLLIEIKADRHVMDVYRDIIDALASLASKEQ